MRTSAVFPAWLRILQGRRPLLSIEITKECPLRCPGCYAYGAEHLGGEAELRDLSDLRGADLVRGVLDLVDRRRPLHVSIVGGEPLVRYRELGELLPALARRNIEVQLVTSAVRPIPAEWSGISLLHLVVSVDGLPPEHDARRAPATYERILRNIGGHHVIVHCTVTREMARREGYLEQFAEFWSCRPEARKIWFSLYTPQDGEISNERLEPGDRERVVAGLAAIRRRFPKVQMPDAVLRGLLKPPGTPGECVFARVTECCSADLETKIEPCQFGGRPVCSECGCIATAGMESLASYRLAGLVKVGHIFEASLRIGQRVGRKREADAERKGPKTCPAPASVGRNSAST